MSEIEKGNKTGTIKEPQSENTEVLIYCGPAINGILPQYAIFRGNLPVHLDKYINGCAAIKQMFVAPKQLAGTRKNIVIKGSRENILFNQALEYLKKEVK